jgi:hypothetical protein
MGRRYAQTPFAKKRKELEKKNCDGKKGCEWQTKK